MKSFSSLLFLIVLTATEPAPARADATGIHGMVLFGDSQAYASHLPMFHAPHDRQLILKVSLKPLPGSHGHASYARAKAGGTTYFTLEPRIMDLEKIASGAKTEFVASVYAGHFERGGHNLGDLKVIVEKVVLSKKLDASAPIHQTEKYFVFGEAGNYFAAHLIASKPSFDAIFEVSRPYELRFPHCRTRVCGDPTQVPVRDESLPIELNGPESADPTQAGLGNWVGPMADVKKTIHVEENDLSH